MSKTPVQAIAAIAKQPYSWAYALGTVLLIASGIVWWSNVYMHPSNVFWGMIESSLSTRSTTIQTKQSSEQGSVEQYVQFELGGVNRARSLATVKQGDTIVKTELIGTPTETYSRYRNIDTNQKNAAGKPLDVSKIEGIWSKRDNDPGSGEAGQQLFAQATIGIGLPLGSVPVPVGELTPSQRQALLKQIKDSNVYDTSFKKVVKTQVNGRLHYTYTVKMQTILYVRMMKTFAQDLGLANLQNIDPNEYANSPTLNVQLRVDAKSRHLAEVSVEGGGYSQRYVSYGVPVLTDIPKKAISNDELQKRLSEL